MVTTGNTVTVFRTTIKAIFGRRRDTNCSPLTTVSTTSPDSMAQGSSNHQSLNLQPNTQVRGLDRNEANGFTSFIRSILKTNLRCRSKSTYFSEEENEQARCLKSATTDFPNNYTKYVTATRHLLDVLAPADPNGRSCSPVWDTCYWQLTLNPEWTEYVIIYSRLEYGLSILTELLDELKPHLNYYQILNLNQGILMHFIDMSYQYWLLQLINQVIGIQLVLSSPTWLYTIANSNIIDAHRAYNLQMVKVRLSKDRKPIIKLYGIPLYIPKKHLVNEFRKLGKLVSYKFAPTGPFTKFHVVQLQYSQKDDRTRIAKDIQKIIKGMKCKVVLKFRVIQPA